MAKNHPDSDARISQALGIYAGMVHHVLAHPQRWLGLDADPPPNAKFPLRVLDAVRDRAFGEITPASPQWSDQPLNKRISWWVTRIGISAGLAAAAPRFAGALADRIPLQSALGASAAGLAVCATAREYGRTQPADWVPLLAKVLFDRDLGADPAPVPAVEESENQLATADDDSPADPGRADKLSHGAQRAAKTLWQLARTFLDLQHLLDERPRGGRLTRVLGKLPVVGVAGGWLDERGGIQKAARETSRLLSDSPH